MRKALQAVLGRDCSASELRELFESTLAQLRDSGAVEMERLLLTERGRARLARALRLRVVPKASKWEEFRRKYVPRLFLELPESSATPSCAAAVIAQRLAVAYDGRSTPTQVVDAWLRGMLGAKKLSKAQLRSAFLARELQLPQRPRADAVLRSATTTLSGAPKADAESVVAALTRRWLLSEPSPPERQRESTSGPPEEALGRFVRRVQRAAESPEARRFGPEKVFIGSVWNALATDPEMASLGENGFKRLLVEAHRRGSLVLAPADLVSAMDPRDLSTSETKHHNATYHFIQRGQPA